MRICKVKAPEPDAAGISQITQLRTDAKTPRTLYSFRTQHEAPNQTAPTTFKFVVTPHSPHGRLLEGSVK